MPSQTLTALLDDACVRFGDTPAIVRDGAPDLTYRALHELSARYANALAARGVRPGDRVMVQVEKSVEAVALYLATVRTGAVFNPLNTAYTPRAQTWSSRRPRSD
ncbi:MAG: AMP-binding protein, partial [Pseudomonadota bacterium]